MPFLAIPVNALYLFPVACGGLYCLLMAALSFWNPRSRFLQWILTKRRCGPVPDHKQLGVRYLGMFVGLAILFISEFLDTGWPLFERVLIFPVVTALFLYGYKLWKKMTGTAQ